jgi:Ca-activated chloride channel family protein
VTVGGSTNIYNGLDLALSDLDADRATSVVLVTDGVTNTGVIEPKEFNRLIKEKDVRIFGFVMGNSTNWPLMQIIANTSGGFSTGESNGDDIVGQIPLAKSKITCESLHHASFSFSGAGMYDTTGDLPGKIYRGQQLVIFGRYDKPGTTTVSLSAKMMGEDRTYTATFDLPALGYRESRDRAPLDNGIRGTDRTSGRGR